MILIHYGELSLKGGNRKYFENKLISNIQQIFSTDKIKNLYGRFTLETQDNNALDKLKKVFGISWFAEAVEVKSDIEEIKKTAWAQMLQVLTDADQTRTNADKITFAIRARRLNKSFPMDSKEIEIAVADYVFDTRNNTELNRAEHTRNLKPLKVDLTNPDLTCYVEIVDKKTFIYTKKIKGAGGLPSGVSGKGLVLISGGIDSPVASYMMMKRGMSLDFIHFHSYPQTGKESIEKVKTLVDILNEYQVSIERKNGRTEEYNAMHCHSSGGWNPGSTIPQNLNNRDSQQQDKNNEINNLFLIPFLEIQKEIVAKCPAKLRVVLYRRMMLRIANEIAKKNSCQAIITGDSLGQVASQTIENMSAITSALSCGYGPRMSASGLQQSAILLRPLVGFDKEEIMDLARKIGTYETSIQPDQDCCSMFVPTHPELRADPLEVARAEEELDIEKMMKEIKLE